MTREHSHSSLNVYNSCSQAYKLKYVDKAKPPLTDKTIELEAGNVAHEALEMFYKLPEASRPQTIDPILDALWNMKLRNAKLTMLYDQLRAIAQDVIELSRRTFLTKGGVVSTAPQKTTEYKRALAALDLPNRSGMVDSLAAMADELWSRVSLAGVYAETWNILGGWRGISEVKQVLFVERHIRGDQLTLPNGAQTQIKIDLGCLLWDNRYAVIDHKTGGKADEPPYAWEVANNDQLLYYGWGLDEVDHRMPDVIGIHHVKGRVLVLADFDYSRSLNAVARKVAVTEGIRRQVYIPRSPTEFGSPCYNKFWGRICPWLPVCHPEVYAEIMNQQDNGG